jgi:hypothetical protein
MVLSGARAVCTLTKTTALHAGTTGEIDEKAKTSLCKRFLTCLHLWLLLLLLLRLLLNHNHNHHHHHQHQNSSLHMAMDLAFMHYITPLHHLPLDCGGASLPRLTREWWW